MLVLARPGCRKPLNTSDDNEYHEQTQLKISKTKRGEDCKATLSAVLKISKTKRPVGSTHSKAHVENKQD